MIETEPKYFTDYKNDFAVFKKELFNKLDSHEEQIVEVSEKVTMLTKDMEIVKTDIKIMKGDIIIMKVDIADMKVDIANIKDDLKWKVDKKNRPASPFAWI